MTKILVIFTKKDTGKYHHFEVYTLSNSLTREKIVEHVEKYNKDDEKDTLIQFYEDELLVNFAEDVQSSTRIENLVNVLKDICHDIEDSVDNLNSWTNEIDDIIKDCKETNNA